MTYINFGFFEIFYKILQMFIDVQECVLEYYT